MTSDCNANEYCDSSYTCTAKESNGGTCTSSDGCVSGLCDYTLSKCAAKKNNDALCSSSGECVSGYCKSFPTSSGCSPGSCYSCTDQSSCDAQTGCNYDTGMSYCTQTSSGNCKAKTALGGSCTENDGCESGHCADSTCKVYCSMNQ